MLGVVILSQEWPGEVFNNCQQIDFTLNNEAKSCFKVKNQPIIGIHQDSAFYTGECFWNHVLIKLMIEKINEAHRIDKLFLALHDTHWIGNNIHGFEKHHFDLDGLEIELADPPNSVVGVVFKHETGSEVYEILIKHLGGRHDFDAGSFIEDINGYMRKLKKNILVKKIHSLRYEILSPLVALDLITQKEVEKEGKCIDDNTKNEVNNAIADIKAAHIETICNILKCGDLKETIESLIPQKNSGHLTIDHRLLVDVAEQLENKIAKLGSTG